MNLRQKIRTGTPVIGTMIQDYTSPIVLPLLEEIGYDFVILDQEHSSITLSDIQNFVLTAKTMNLSVLVRVSSITYDRIAKVLDMGVDGLMIPHVDTAKQVEEIVSHARYPPIGKRSYGIRKQLCGFGPFKDKQDYIKKANQHIVLLIQVESPQSVENYEEMVKNSHIDGVIIGPMDLSMNMGIIDQVENVVFTSAVDRILRISKNNKKGFGIHLGNINAAAEWKEKGANILLYGTITKMAMREAKRVFANLANNEKLEEDDGIY